MSLSFFDLYFWPFLAAGFCGAALSLVGMQTAARGQSLDSILLVQMAALAALIGFIVNEHFFLMEGIPALSAWIFSLIGMYIFEFLVKEQPLSLIVIQLSIICIIQTFMHTLVSLMPGLDAVLTSTLFGDLGLISILQAKTICAFSILSLILLYLFWNKINLGTFEWVQKSGRLLGKNLFGSEFLLKGIKISILSFSVISFGMLFTLGCLFISISFLEVRRRGLFGSFFSLVILNILTGLGSFFLSSQFESLPATSSYLLILFLVSILFSFSIKLFKTFFRHKKVLQ